MNEFPGSQAGSFLPLCRSQHADRESTQVFRVVRKRNCRVNVGATVQSEEFDLACEVRKQRDRAIASPELTHIVFRTSVP